MKSNLKTHCTAGPKSPKRISAKKAALPSAFYDHDGLRALHGMITERELESVSLRVAIGELCGALIRNSDSDISRSIQHIQTLLHQANAEHKDRNELCGFLIEKHKDRNAVSEYLAERSLAANGAKARASVPIPSKSGTVEPKSAANAQHAANADADDSSKSGSRSDNKSRKSIRRDARKSAAAHRSRRRVRRQDKQGSATDPSK